MVDHNSQPPRPSTRTDARIERTRGSLRTALLELLETTAFDAITVRDIVAKAGVGYATFFRHYTDQRDLLNNLASGETRELFARAIPILNAADTRAACLALCAYVGGRRRLWTSLLTGGAAGVMREEFLNQARQAALAGGPTDDWPPNDLKVIFGVAGAIEILAWWLRDRPDLTEARVAETLDSLVVAPLLD